MKQSKRSAKNAGQGFVEFALILPILLFMVMGILDFGRIFMVYAQASHSLRDAVRRATVSGQPGGPPYYLDCDTMRGIAERVLFASDIEITIQYVKESDPSVTYDCDSVSADALQNGDMLVLTSQAKIAPITPFISGVARELVFNFRAQRTIVKQIDLGEEEIDSDADGLADDWEERWFGDNDNIVEPGELDRGATDDSDDNDGCNLGCEETYNTDPFNPDSDGDGLLDGEEIYEYHTYPMDPNTDEQFEPVNINDGLDDGEEVLGVELTWCDPVVTYTSDPHKPDTDGDGLLDGDELDVCADPNNPDTDGDGLNDYDEVNVYSTKPNDADTDDDTLSDYDEAVTYHTNPLSPDPDNDGLTDPEEVFGYTVDIHGTSVHFTTDPHNADPDGDGLTDKDERDGWASQVNGEEVHFYPDPNAANADGDGLNDLQERTHLTDPNSADTDGDDLTDDHEVNNPPLNPLVEDSGDVDRDGLPDLWEREHFGNLNPRRNGDPDGDGCTNICEYDNGLLPRDNDTDDDGLLDGQEVIGEGSGYNFPYNTDPTNPDTDNDGLLDGAEVTEHTTNPAHRDTDADGRTDGQEVNGFSAQISINGSTRRMDFTSNPLAPHSDNDGWDDREEFLRRTNPRNADTDGDGLADDEEPNSDPRDDDTDDDDLRDGFEVNGYRIAGQRCHSNPASPDTDGDYRNDGDEYEDGTNPCSAETPRLRINNVRVNERAGTATFTVTLDSPVGTVVTVNYATADVTARAGQDYTATSGRLTFNAVVPPPDSMTRTITVPILRDNRDEPTETFVVNLTSASGAVIADRRGMGTITDTNDPPQLTIDNVRVRENAGWATFTISLSAPSGNTVTVNVRTLNGTAHAGRDFTAIRGRNITFAPGQRTQTVRVFITNDNLRERNEFFKVVLRNPTNATIADGMGRGSIRDDDRGS